MIANSPYYAHSANRAGDWHRLSEHLQAVADLVGEFADGLPWQDEARLAALLHDLGKYGERFQDRLQGKAHGIDHWTSGAGLALQKYQALAAALTIQGHHLGLQCLDVSSLRRLALRQIDAQRTASTDAFESLSACLQTDGINPAPPAQTVLGKDPTARLDRMLDVRLLFSTVVDADFLDTEAHFKGDAHGKYQRPSAPALQAEHALALLLQHIETLGQSHHAAARVRVARRRLREDCLNAAVDSTGVFTLTAPTGSGKTLAMLAFALAHAQQHGLRRIVLAIPYLSILEQTAAVYRAIFAPHFGPNYVLEHHSLAGVGAELNTDDQEGHSGEQERRRRLAAENWDAPLVITTNVQLLESLFSNRSSRCRKLHRLTRAVLMFDEAQTLPTTLATPTLAALAHLAQGYGSSVVFATATQPAFSHLNSAVQKHCATGWQPREIVRNTAALFAPLQRCQLNWDNVEQALSWPELAARVRPHRQVLSIVNLKRHAHELWQALDQDDALLLSTDLCPAHRQTALDTVRRRLAAGQAIQLVATQCIEAGVDVDFPVVYRACGPLDAIIQAAGRCNREGQRDSGQVHVFVPVDEGYPDAAYQQAAEVTRGLLREYGPAGMALHDPDFISAYYRRLYDFSRPESQSTELVQAIQAGAFPEVAERYRLIRQDVIQIVVPYAPQLALFEDLQVQADRAGITRDWIRRAQPLTVSLFRPKEDDVRRDSLLPLQTNLSTRGQGEDWYQLANPDHYHATLGLQIPKLLNAWIG